MTFKALAAVAVSSLFIASCGETPKEAITETENTMTEVTTEEVVTYKAEEKSKGLTSCSVSSRGRTVTS